MLGFWGGCPGILFTILDMNFREFHTSTKVVNKGKKRKRQGEAAYRRLPQPYISADTAKYNTSAHEPISATPANHSIDSTITTGIFKNRSKARPIPTDKRAEKVLGDTGVAFGASPIFACSIDMRPT
jgi:hypothetical protein